MIIIEQARGAAGCLDCAVTADLIDPGRVNIFERWESQGAVESFRRSGPVFEQAAAMLSVSVAEYDIADVRPCSEKAAHDRQHGPWSSARARGCSPTPARTERSSWPNRGPLPAG